MAQTIIDLLNKGIEANHADKHRRDNLICLPADGSLVVTGDLHGHLRNFERISAYADLENNPKRHLILQEIIHGGPEDTLGGCLSYKLLFDIIRYKLSFPDRVHFAEDIRGEFVAEENHPALLLLIVGVEEAAARLRIVLA